MKLITSSLTVWLNKLERLPSASFFLYSLIFTGKARSLPLDWYVLTLGYVARGQTL